MGPLSLNSVEFEIEPNKSLQLSPKVDDLVRDGAVANRLEGSALLIRRRN